MEISLDGGALCTENNRRFGNYIFSENLIKALFQYDKGNKYFIYAFCKRPNWLKESRLIHFKTLRPKTLWLSSRVSLEELRQPKNIFLALNQAIPIASAKKIISFSHGLSFHFFPNLYGDLYYALNDQLNPMIKRSKYVIVSSRKVKKEMAKIYSKYSKVIVNNYGVPYDMLKNENRPKKKYFIFVGMNHPIKHIDFLIRAFHEFRKSKKFSEFKLFLIGNLKNFADLTENIFSYEVADREALRKVYSQAIAYLTASHYESYNIPILESLSQNCQVIGLKSAVIPEFKPFVFLADDLNGFVAQMQNVASGKRKDFTPEYIRRTFSWKKYVNKLISLY